MRLPSAVLPAAAAESRDADDVGPDGPDVTVRRRARAKVAIFVVLMAVFAAIVEAILFCVPFGTRLGPLTWTASWAFMLLMWSVGFAGLITLAAIDRSWRDVGFKSASRHYWLLAMALPVIYCAAVYIPVWIFGLGEFAGISRLGRAVLSAGLYFPIYLLAATGEEVGWRGVLVPNLARCADARLVAFLPGAIWAVWHYPNIVLFGSSATPLPLALICFSLMVIGHGVFLSWLRLSSGSVWPPAVFHGAHNALVYGIFDRATEPGALTAYVTTEFGVGLSAAGLVIGYLFWSRLRASIPAQRKRDLPVGA